jgi:hypothetical protein
MRRGWLGFALGIVLWARTGRAVDDGPRVTLAVTRGDGTAACIRERAVERAVERRLRRRVFAEAGSADLRIDVTLAREADRSWSAKLVLRGPDGAELGARELDTRAPHCSSLDESLVLVVALLVDSPEAHEAIEAARTPAKPSSSDSVSTSITPRPAVPSARAPKPTPIEIPPDTFAPREPYRFELGAGVGALAGALPGLPLGASLSLGVRPPHFVEVRVRPQIFFPHEAHAPSADRGGSFSLLAVALELCPFEHTLGKLGILGCVGQRVGRVAARGFGFQETHRSVELYYALGVSAGAAFWFAPPLGFELELGAEAPLTRDSYFSRGPSGESRKIFQASPVTGAATAGFLVAF